MCFDRVMSDEDRYQGPPRPPLPEPYTIPAQLVTNWLDIPPHADLEIRLNRTDFDSLYTAFNRSLEAQQSFQSSMIHYTNGRTDAANDLHYDSQRLLIESQNAFRRFFLAVMTSAKVSGGNG